MTEKCEHDSYETVGKFPDCMYVDGEQMANDIICDECGAKGKEFYEFTNRIWIDENGNEVDEYD